jgi:hypothetical protein
MTPRTLISAAAGAALLGACAYPMPRIESAAPCNGPQCEVAVAASHHDMLGTGCFIDRISPHTLEAGRGRTVTWYVDHGSVSKGFRFSPRGVAFATAGWNCTAEAANTRIQCTSKADVGEHPYRVELANGSTICESLEAFVVSR